MAQPIRVQVPGPADLLQLVGTELDCAFTTTLSESNLEQFARATGESSQEFIPSNFLLSLVNLFLPEMLVVESFSMGVNVGLDSVSFPTPAKLSDPLTARGLVLSADQIGEGVQVVVRVTMQSGGADVCVADTVSRFFA